MTRTLETVVVQVAAELMAANAVNHVAISERVLADLVTYFGVDGGFLRHNDHTIHATVRVASWPPVETFTDTDPLRVVYFADADSVFAMTEYLKEPGVLRPAPANADYQRHIEESRGFPTSSVAWVPLLSGDLTTGTLGFIKSGDRDWAPAELNALQAIGTLFAQLQARIAAENQVRYAAEHDDLTGLLNRRALMAHLDERLVADQRGPVAILFLDLDRLKVVVDHLGQDAGDRFIKAFAERLREAADVPSVVARVGGDEFVVVPAAPMDVDGAERFAQRLQNRVHQPLVIDDDEFSRSVSIGVAAGVPGRQDASDLLRRVEQAIGSAKSSGGGKVAPFSATLSEQYAIRSDIERRLPEAIDRGSKELMLHYLPEFDLRTGEVLGVEALVRWRHPTRGLLMPESFVGVAESMNLSAKLGRVVARSAVQQLALWRSRGAGRDILLRINVSPMQLVAAGMAERVAELVDEFCIDASATCVEITEGVLVQDVDATRETLTELKNIGTKIAIDDFGTGYSGFTYLKSLPVDTLKIDQRFIRELGTNPGDLAIVRSVMALAEAFALDVVAEGVETEVAARTLLDLGCCRAQGFLLSRPLDAEATESLLARGFAPMNFTGVRH